MKHLALVLLLVSSSAFAQTKSQVDLCGEVAKQAANLQKLRGVMARIEMVYTASSFFKAREEHYPVVRANNPSISPEDLEKMIVIMRKMDTFVAGKVFAFPSSSPMISVGDWAQSRCLELTPDQLLEQLGAR
jgi:hypothetical protein